ncbi:iron chaperone [Lysinibacter cavernae]|uniref:Uncharacterized protein YdhG (YjbR/CyaY superfamily) n=1 Tax=Lysinibacter cavernae TaxID=1640652 RepID=A0A7X5R474_9MICO|nr:DUF1801 domain-containing protein [Lysinibacter cavernae]NIH55348.1 uncharacterized protein YdhG (YjbR/CyaY superfamily) [Lysinibacter cavernae]
MPDQTDVTDYIAAAAEPERSLLAELYNRARELAPGATEGTSYGMPALRYRSRPLISIVTLKQGLALYPFSSTVVSSVADDLVGFAVTKGGFRFSVDQPVPKSVFDRVVRRRRAEIEAAVSG